MVKVSNVFGDKYSGKVGDAGVFATWKGRQYRRTYVKPANPNTPAQQAVRGSFADAVDKWHTFNPLQAQSYKPMAAGQVMSGFNLFVKRWQKMTAAQRAAYVAPYVGFKQVGSGAMSTEQSASTVANQQEYTLGTKPIVIGTVGFTKGTGNLDPVAVIDLIRGRIDVLKSITGDITADYTSGGKAVVGEIIQTNASAGDIIYLDNLDIDSGSFALKVGGSEAQALAVDIVAHKVEVCGADTYTLGGTILYKNYTPVNQVKYELFKAQTQFNTARAYSDATGIIKLAQTSEDGNRDGKFQSGAYADIIRSNLSAEDAAKDEYVALSAL